MIGDSPLAFEFWERGHSASCPIYDMHGHMGTMASIYFPRADAADMVRTMDEAGVSYHVPGDYKADTYETVLSFNYRF